MIHTVRKDEQGNYILQNDGKDMICPFQNALAIPQQNALHQIQTAIIKHPCSTSCPFADYFETGNITQYTIECMLVNKTFDIIEPKKIDLL